MGLGCGRASTRTELNFAMKLAIPQQPGAQNQPVQFQTFLNDYFTPNQDFEKNCACTGMNMYHVREYAYERMRPGTFINMQAMRFDANMQKLNAPIQEVPLRFDMSFDRGTTVTTLELKSFVVHQGTFNAGHYFSFGRTNNGWMRFDDVRPRAEPRTEAQVLAALENVFFMLWEVVGSAPAPAVVGNNQFHYRAVH